MIAMVFAKSTQDNLEIATPGNSIGKNRTESKMVCMTNRKNKIAKNHSSCSLGLSLVSGNCDKPSRVFRASALPKTRLTREINKTIDIDTIENVLGISPFKTNL